MSAVYEALMRQSDAYRRARREQFQRLFRITPDSRILDLGSEDGRHILSVLEGTDYRPSNVWIADINEAQVRAGAEKYGFQPVVLPEGEARLPFEDRFFDVVHCSSVIEHVTVPKDQVWSMASDREFKRRSAIAQNQLAAEIRRVAKGHYVQTPYRWFVFETHALLPFFGYLPRRAQIGLLRGTNKLYRRGLWIKYLYPDFHLLNGTSLRGMFPDSEVMEERTAGLVKSLIAFRPA
jgi:SAM-dependent methyltransferase